MRLLILVLYCLCLEVYPIHVLQTESITPATVGKLGLARQLNGGSFGGIVWTADSAQVIVQRGYHLEFYDAKLPQMPTRTLPNAFYEGRLQVAGEWLYTTYALSVGRTNLRTGETYRIGELAYVYLSALSKDGKWLATYQEASNPGYVNLRVWDARTGELVTVLEGIRYRVELLTFGDDNQTLFAVSQNTVYRWQIDPAEVLHVYRPVPNLSPLDMQARILSPHGDQFAFYNLKTRQIEIYDLRTETLLTGIKASQPPIWMVFDTDGSRIAAIFNGFFTIWSVSDGRSIGTWKRTETEFNFYYDSIYPKFAFSPDHARIAYSDQGALIIQELAPGGQTHRITTQDFGLVSGATGILGTQVGSHQSTLYDWETAAPRASFPKSDSAWLTPDGQFYLAEEGNHLKVWDAITGKPLPITLGTPPLLAPITISADSRTVIAIGSERAVRRIDIQTGKTQIVQLPKPPPIPRPQYYSMRGDYRISGDGHYFYSFLGSDTSDWQVTIYDTLSGQVAGEFSLGVKSASVPAIQMSRDGHWMLFNQVLWDMEQRKPQYTLNISVAYDRLVAFSADGSLLAYRPPVKSMQPLGAVGWVPPPDPTAETTPKLQIINTQTGETLVTLPNDVTNITGIAFSPEGRHLLLRSREGSVQIYEVIP